MKSELDFLIGGLDCQPSSKTFNENIFDMLFSHIFSYYRQMLSGWQDYLIHNVVTLKK